MPRPWPCTPTWTIPWGGGGVAGRRTGPYIYLYINIVYDNPSTRMTIMVITTIFHSNNSPFCQLNTSEWPYAICHYPTEFILGPTLGPIRSALPCLRRMVLKPEAGVDAPDLDNQTDLYHIDYILYNTYIYIYHLCHLQVESAKFN